MSSVRNADVPMSEQIRLIKRDLCFISWLADYGYEAEDKQEALIKIIENAAYKHQNIDIQ